MSNRWMSCGWMVAACVLIACGEDGTGGGGGTATGGTGGTGGMVGTGGDAGGMGGMGGSALTTEELAYDDGGFEQPNSPWSTEPGGQIAVRFTPPDHPATIRSVSFYVAATAGGTPPVGVGIPTVPFEVRVYEDDGNGTPGSPLLMDTVTAAATTGDEWVDVDLTSYDLSVASGDFFVAMYWTTAPGTMGADAQFLGTDTSEPDDRTWWMSPGTSWIPIGTVPTPGNERDAGIRATVTY